MLEQRGFAGNHGWGGYGVGPGMTGAHGHASGDHGMMGGHYGRDR